MDLSALSCDLPSAKAVSESSVKEVAQELTTEFKNAAKAVAGLYSVAAAANNASGGVSRTTKSAAELKQDFSDTAKSVASLYRLANSSTSLFRLKGYMDCLDEILEVISNGEDIENWVLTRKAEISNLHKADQHPSQSSYMIRGSEMVLLLPLLLLSDNESQDAGEEEFSIPQDFQFKMPDSLTVPHHFRPSHPPLSVQHSKKQILQHKMKLNELANKRRSLRVPDQSSDEEADGATTDQSASEGETRQLAVSEGEEPRKRRRFAEDAVPLA